MVGDPETSPKNTSSQDPLFDYEDSIFANEELLNPQHVPNPDRIIGRDDQIQTVAQELNPVVHGSTPSHLLIYGRSGTGKSLVTRHVSERAINAAESRDITVKTIYVDCAELETKASVFHHIGEVLNEPETGITFPEHGVGSSTYTSRMWSVINSLYDVVLVILDEIDQVREGEDMDILFQLSRAEEAGKIDKHLGVIGISNDIYYPDNLESRVRSSFQPKDIVFDSYDANELRAILKARRDAFREGVLSDDVIPLCSAFAAQDHGDARRAIDLLRESGKLARNQGDDKVTEKHVRSSEGVADAKRFIELVEGSPTQPKLALLSLAALTKYSGEEYFRKRPIYGLYKRIAQKLDADQLGSRRIVDHLKEQKTNGFVDIDLAGGGRNRGTYNEFHLKEDADIAIETIMNDTRFNNDLSEDDLRQLSEIALKWD